MVLQKSFCHTNMVLKKHFLLLQLKSLCCFFVESFFGILWWIEMSKDTAAFDQFNAYLQNKSNNFLEKEKLLLTPNFWTVGYILLKINCWIIFTFSYLSLIWQSQLLVLHFPKNMNKGFVALSKHCCLRAHHVHLWLKQWQAFRARLPVISCLSGNCLGRDGWKGLNNHYCHFTWWCTWPQTGALKNMGIICNILIIIIHLALY